MPPPRLQAAIGAGAQPAGWSPPALYFAAPVVPPYVVFPDSRTGLADTGRLIDPGTRQFIYSAGGDPLGMTTAQQLVFVAWGKINVQAAVPTFVAGWEVAVQRLYESAAKWLTANKIIVIRGFSIYGVKRTNFVSVTIDWTDLTSGVEDTYTPSPP